MARSGATVGKAFLVRELHGEACHAGYLIRARVNKERLLPEFIFAFTQTAAFARWKNATFNTATIQNIGADKYANLSVPLPTTSEQARILTYLSVAVTPVRLATARVEREIALIREYRTRLIADVVTGQVDVREAVKQLPPDEPVADDTQEPLDDVESDDDVVEEEDG